MKKVYSIFEPQEITPPTPIVKVQYVKSQSKLKLYVVNKTYINLTTNYITYATSKPVLNAQGGYDTVMERCDSSTKTAFAKSYLLILCMIEHGLDAIPVETIGRIVGVSDKTMTKIIGWLQNTWLLYIDNEEWKEDVRKVSAGEKDITFHPYKYVLSSYPDFCRSYPEYCQITAKGFSDFDTENPSRDPKLVCITYDNIPDSWSEYFLPWKSFLTKAEASIQKATKEQLPVSASYVSPYSELTLDFQSLRRLRNVSGRIRNGIIKWTRNFYKAPVYNGGRMYHIFHQTPHELRGYLLYKGSPLVEAFDLHNAYYTLLLFKLNGVISPSEYAKYRTLVNTGKFYEDVQHKAGLPTRDAAKLLLQRYRNCTIKQVASKTRKEPELGRIDEYFKTEFPEIREFLDSYPRKDGKKLLQADMCLVEWNVFQPICQMLHDTYGVTPFSLHDGIYLNETDINLLTNRVSWKAIENQFIWSKV